jgi:hypothetical protein
MTEGFASIIAQLERQKTAIERAIAALREVDGTEASAPAAAPSSSPATRKSGRSAKQRNLRSEGQKKRWAAKKAAESALATAPQKAAPRKGHITPEGRQKLAEAMKRRWAAKRAAAAVKKTPRKSTTKKAA